MLIPSLSILFLVSQSFCDQQFHKYHPYHQKHLQHQNQIHKHTHRSSKAVPSYPRNSLVRSSSPHYVPVRKDFRVSHQSQNRNQRQLHQKYQRQPILIKPGQFQQQYRPRTDIRHHKNIFPSHNYRGTRKLEQTPLKTASHNHVTSATKKKIIEHKHHLKAKNDNLAVESVENRVKVAFPSQTAHGYQVKPQAGIKSSHNRVKPVAEVPVKRAYNSPAPAQPKFIIQQAGKIGKK